MQNKHTAMEFLECYLPQKVKELLDISSVKIEPESFVEKNLRRRLSDVIYSVKTKNGETAFVYTLIECQSKPDRFMALKPYLGRAKKSIKPFQI